MIGTLLWGAMALLVVLAWVKIRSRLEEGSRARSTRVDDDDVRRIVEEGRLHTDEDNPLDLEQIEEEERRFWEESWDEPEEW